MSLVEGDMSADSVTEGSTKTRTASTSWTHIGFSANEKKRIFSVPASSMLTWQLNQPRKYFCVPPVPRYVVEKLHSVASNATCVDKWLPFERAEGTNEREKWRKKNRESSPPAYRQQWALLLHSGKHYGHWQLEIHAGQRLYAFWVWLCRLRRCESVSLSLPWET